MEQQPGGFTYEVCIEGQLDANWSDWFGGLQVLHLPDGNTLLVGWVPDQPALHGLLTRLNYLGLVLVSVQRTEPET
jgi:hypothetical protein